MPLERSSSWELLLVLQRGAGPLHAQLEDAVRAGVRDGRLVPGTVLPGSRGLAAELGVSRSVVTEAYGQLAAEGWIRLTSRRAPRVAEAPATAPPAGAPTDGEPGPRPRPAPTGVRWDLRPGGPDLSLFPREEWVRSVRSALRDAPDAALDYPPASGEPALRAALASYLGRVRGVVPTDPAGPLVCAGTSGALALAVAALRDAGVRRVAVEDPGHAGVRAIVAESGCEVVGVPVDADGLVVEALPDDVGAVLVTPAHQFPTGVVLSPARRGALLAWAARTGACVIEDDYDAEFRYDGTPVGALQGLAPDRVAAMGSASKTLAPGLRLGWLTLPPALLPHAHRARPLSDLGRFAVDQLAFADLLGRGAYDRHLRRARRSYRERRDVTARVLAGTGVLGGIAAGLHLTLTLDGDEGQLVAAAARAGVAVDALGQHRLTAPVDGRATLLVGFGRVAAPAVPAAAAALATSLAA